jgi:hypothetical protein
MHFIIQTTILIPKLREFERRRGGGYRDIPIINVKN